MCMDGKGKIHIEIVHVYAKCQIENLETKQTKNVIMLQKRKINELHK